MRLKLVLYAIPLCLAAMSFAQGEPDSVTTPVQPAIDSAAQQPPVDELDVAFSHAYFSIEGGEMYPFGDLVEAIENSFYGGIGFRYSYWSDFDGFVHFNYSYVKIFADGIQFPGVHQFTGRLGLDWKWSLFRPLALGAGFTCNWTRADTEDGTKFYSGRGGMLLDNETEFGWFVRVNMPFLYFREYTAGLNVLWEELWTLPKRSDMLTIGFYIERRVW